MDQDLQDLHKLNLVELEEKLHEINNNNRVSFNEHECESINDSPIEKEPKKIRKSRSKQIDLSDEEVQQEEKIAKPKRELSQKQKEAFEKAIELEPENPEAHCKMAMYYLSRGDMKGLKKEYEHLKTLDAALAEQIGTLFF